MVMKKLFSIILLMSNLANIECHEHEYKTLASLIDKKIYNKSSNTLSNNDTIFNDNSSIHDINNYINDDLVNPNPAPLFIRGKLTERENKYYLDRMSDIMNGNCIRPLKDEDQLSDLLSESSEHEDYNEYAPKLVFDPDDKYTNSEAKSVSYNLISNGKVIDSEVLEHIANRFGKNNTINFIYKYMLYIFNIFNILYKEEDILDYYELLHYNLIQIPVSEKTFFQEIRSVALILKSDNVMFQIKQNNEYYSFLITLTINALQKPISDILKGNNNINLLEKIIYNTNKNNNNVFILDSIINSIISILKDDTFINDKNNMNKLLNNFNIYTKYISNADKIYINNRLKDVLNNIKSLDNDTNQCNNLNLLINSLKYSLLPIELKDKNDLVLTLKFKNKDLINILKYSFDKNINTNVQNKNIEIIINTLNDNNIDNDIKFYLLNYIIQFVNLYSGNVDLTLFCKNFVYLLEEENFYTLLYITNKLRNEIIKFQPNNKQHIEYIKDDIIDCFIRKMLELKLNVNNVNIIKFKENTNEECIKKRIQFINSVLYEILWKENNSKIFSQSLNNSANNIYQTEFINGIINLALQMNIFDNNKNNSKTYKKNLIVHLKALNDNITNIFENTINNLLNKNTTNNKYILKQLLKYLNKTSVDDIKTDNDFNNINNQYNINENNQINVNNKNVVNISNDVNVNGVSDNTNERNIVNNTSDIIDQDMKDYTNEYENINENINNDARLKFNDTISLIICNNINTHDDLVNFINNNNSKEDNKTILKSIINFVVKNETSIYNKNFVNNVIPKLNNDSLTIFKKLVIEKQKDIDKNTELYKTYGKLIKQCEHYICINNCDNNCNNNFVEVTKKKRNRSIKKEENKQIKQSNNQKKIKYTQKKKK